MLADGGQDVADAIKFVLARQPFQHVCQRLLHCIGDSDLSDFLSGILGKSSSQRQLEHLVAAAAREAAPTAALAAQQLEQCLQLMMFGCANWQSLDALAANVAWAFHFQQSFNSLQTSDNAQVMCQTCIITLSCIACCCEDAHCCCMLLLGVSKLVRRLPTNALPCMQEFVQQAASICKAESAPLFWRMLSHSFQRPDDRSFHQVLLSLLAVRCTLAQQITSSKQQVQLLIEAGVVVTQTATLQHDLLRAPKKRRSHKHKRQKHKRRRTEGMMPMSSDEDISDSELGIMPAELDEAERQPHLVWKVQIADQVYREVSGHDLPDLILQSVLMRWLSHLLKQ